MKPLLALIALLLLSIAGALAFSYSGLLDIAATAKEPAPLRWLLENARIHSIRKQAAEIEVPPLADDRWRAGVKAYDDMCARCHGAPGKAPFVGAKDMNPPPPNLAEAARQRSLAELFWVIENGIRMTGMPAWGATHSVDQLWDLVTFVRRLPRFSSADYQEALASDAGSYSHDAGGHSRDRGHRHQAPAAENQDGNGHNH